MGELTLKTIMHGFINAENEFPRYIQRRFFSLSDSFPKRSDSNFKVKKAEQKGFFDFWVPEYFTNCFGKAEIGLSDDQIRHISAGRKKKVVETLQSQFENNSVQMFWDYKEHIEKALEWHIKVFICSKNKGLSIFDGENVRITESELTEAIKAKAEEYENTLKAFKNRMLESILQSQEYLSDERIAKSEFHGLLTDEKRDEIERLTILSIFGLFSAVTVENEDYYFKQIYKKIFDEKTNELKSLPKTKGKQVRIDREAIWHAGKNWYEQTRIEGNRFSKLFPETELLPLAGTIPIYAHSTNNQEKPLMKLINETSGHIYLIGEGGIGKTTALYSIMENAYNNSKGTMYPQVPLFIELSRAYKSRDFDLDRGKSEFILHTVQNQLQASLKTKANLEEQIEDEFQKDTDEPEYVLLLDGLNEVSREEIKGHVILQMVVAEIMYIMANYKNVRVILTSRSEEKLNGEAKSLYLSGINPKQIEIFLGDKKVSEARIKETLINSQLMEILRVPLFLITYAELKGEDEIFSRGEILHAFFSKTNKDLYSERDRIETINAEFAKETGVDRSEGSKDCITPHMLNFILEFIMPQIAWNMAKENEFQIKRAGIKKAVKQVLTDKTETSFISEYGIEFFSEYLTGEDENIRTTVERIKKIFGADGSEGMDSISSGVLKCLTKQFGLLVTNDYKEYEVLHQHIRDYFAALYHINKLKLAAYINEQGDRDKAIECLSDIVKEPLPGQILVFIGEALGELHNVPELNEETNEWIKKEPDKGTERDLINRSFDIFRGISNDDDNYAVWNLFQILKLVREDLSGTDLSGLDLRSCRANGYKLGNQTFVAKLDNAILTDEFFMPSGHSSGISSAVYSPDGKFIVTISDIEKAIVWDAKSFNTVYEGVLEGTSTVQYSPDGKYIVTTSMDGSVKLWDANTFKKIPGGILKGNKHGVTSVSFSPDGKYIVTVSYDGSVKVWDANTFKEIPGGTLKGYTGMVNSAVYSPDGTCILTVSYDETAKVWDAKTYKEIPGGTMEGHTIGVKSAVYSPDGTCILTIYYDRTVKVWDANTFKEIPGGTLKGYTIGVHSAVYSPDGKHIMTVSYDGSVKVWDANTFKEIPGGTLKGYTGMVKSAVYSPDGTCILTVSYNGTAKVWDAKTYKEIPGGILCRKNGSVYSAQYSPDGKHIVTVSNDGPVKVWDAETYSIVPRGFLRGHKDRVYSAQYSPDGKYIVTASRDGTAKVWNTETYTEVPGGTLNRHKDAVFSAQYSPDGKYIVTASQDGTAKVWDTKTYTEVPGGTLDEQHDAVYTACYSPDGKYILTAVYSGEARIWDAKKFTRVYKGVIRRPTRGRTSAKYSPDGNYIITTYDNKAARIWDTTLFTNVLHGVLPYQPRNIAFAQYSPDGKYIVTAAEDGIVKIWNAILFKGIPGGILKGHTKAVNTAVYSPDMKYIITASDDETVKIWDAKTFIEIHTITNVSGLDVMNVDLRELNEASYISDKTEQILKDYGAIIE